MKFSISEIRSKVERCQTAERDLAALRQQVGEKRADLAQAESQATAKAADSKLFDRYVDGLETKRRAVSELEYRVQLHEKNIQLMRADLRQVMTEVCYAAGARCAALRTAVIAELQRRIAPFVAAKVAKYAIPQAQILPLVEPMKLCGVIAALLEQVAANSTAASASLLLKYEQFVSSVQAVETKLGIAAKR